MAHECVSTKFSFTGRSCVFGECMHFLCIEGEHPSIVNFYLFFMYIRVAKILENLGKYLFSSQKHR